MSAIAKPILTVSGRALRCCRGLLYVLACAVCFAACRDDGHYSTDARHRLTFSADTVAFDTLFTGVGSATRIVQVHNATDSHLHLPEIRLAGGSGSPFRVNVDGQYGERFADVDLLAGDSLFVFVEVTVPPSDAADGPFAVSDSLVFTLPSGQSQHLLFTASGWDVVTLRAVTLNADTTISSSAVVFDSLVVASGVTLRLAPATTLFFHDGAGLSVHGTLQAVGTPDSVITFRGDRIDRMFDDLPYDRVAGLWEGITLNADSHDNVFTYCDIHSGHYGVRAEAGDTAYTKVTFSGTHVHTVTGDAFSGTLVKGAAVNSLFTNAGDYCVRLMGGQFDFLHCTLANFYPQSAFHLGALNLNNYDEESHLIYPLTGVTFRNCIVTGSIATSGVNDQISGSVAESLGDSLDLSSLACYHFSHSLLCTPMVDDTVHYTAIAWEGSDSLPGGRVNFLPNPALRLYDFHLDSLSRARGLGDLAVALDASPIDRDGLPRDTVADAGCYQYRLVPVSPDEE